MNFASQQSHAAQASRDFTSSRTLSRLPSFGPSTSTSEHFNLTRATTPSDYSAEHRKRNRTNSDTCDPQHRSKLARSTSNVSPLTDYEGSVSSSSSTCHQQPHAPSAGRLPTPLTPPSSSEGKYFDGAPVPDTRRRSEAWGSSRCGWGVAAKFSRDDVDSGMYAGVRDGARFQASAHGRSRSMAMEENALRRFGRMAGATGEHTRPPPSPKPTNSDATLSFKPSEHRLYGQAPDLSQNRRPSLTVDSKPKLPSFSQLPEDRLTAVTVVALESIWKCPPPAVPIEPGRKPLYPSEQHLPLDEFIRETIRRSRTPPPVHRLALVYLHRCRHKIHETVLSIRQAADELYQLLVNSPRGSQSSRFAHGSQPSTAVNREEAALLWRQCNNPVGDGRKMFLAALMCAWKFMQDSNYSNKAWSKITGLEVSKVSANERVFLEIIDWQLNVTTSYFEQWEARLEKLADETAARSHSLTAARSPTTHAPPSPISPELRPDPTRRGSLNRSTTEYLPAPGTTEVRVASIAAPSHAVQAQLPKSGTEPSLAGLSLAPPSPGSDGHQDLTSMDVDRNVTAAQRDTRDSTLVARQRRAPPKPPSAAIGLGRRPTLTQGDGRTTSTSVFSNHPLGRTLSHGGLARRPSVGHMGSHSDLHHLSSFARWTPVN